VLPFRSFQFRNLPAQGCQFSEELLFGFPLFITLSFYLPCNIDCRGDIRHCAGSRSRFIPFLLGTVDNKASLSLQNFSRKLLSILAHKIKPGMVAVGMAADGDQLSDVGS